jgi:Phage P22-like portal protein
MKKDYEFLALARKRFAQAVEDEAEIRKVAREDLAFVSGEQWDAALKRQRQEAGRPALTFNKLHTFVQQVSNEARQNKTQIYFRPVDSGADVDTAEVMEGLARHIQYNSDASISFETATDHSSSCGFGYLRLITEYCDDSSFDQELRLKPIFDPFSVYGVVVPSCLGQKVRWAFIVEDMPREEYEAKYPDSAVANFNFDTETIGDWADDERVRVAEYLTLESEQKRLCELPDGATCYFEEVPPGAPVVRSRPVWVDTIESCLINGAEVLPDTGTEWPDKEIPIVPVLGKQMILNGKPYLFSVIRHAKEAQQLYNYYKSSIGEMLMLAPKAPYIGYAGQFKSKAHEWQRANIKSYAYLEVDPVVLPNGQVAPLPQRNTFEPPIQALSAAAMQEADDMKATTGIYDAALGARSNETSGVAIEKRQRESDVSNFHFLDNLTRAQTRLGRMIARLIPKIYDTAREVRVLGEDEEQKIVKVNQLFLDEKGKARHYQLDAGRYDIVADTQPLYTTQRLQAFNMMTQFAQAYPPLLQIGGDIVFRNSDMPGAVELSKRFKKALPPGLAAEDDEGPAKIPPQVQQQMQALGQQHDQLVATVNQLTEEIKTKALEMQSRERIAAAEMKSREAQTAMAEETKRAIAIAQLNSREGVALLESQLAELDSKYGRLHDLMMQGQEAANQAATARAQQSHQRQMQDAVHAHQSQMQDWQEQHQANMQDAQQAHQADLQSAQQAFQSHQAERQPAGANSTGE